MTHRWSLRVAAPVVLFALLAGGGAVARAQSSPSIQAQIDANTQMLVSIQEKIAQYQRQLDALGVEKTTLQSAINALTLTQQKLTAQIGATQTKIASANLELKKLAGSIGATEQSISENQQAIAKALRSVAQDEGRSLVTRVFSSDSLRDAWQVTDEAVQLNRALTEHVAQLHVAKTVLTENRDAVAQTKATLQSLQQDLTSQKRSVIASKNAEQELLKQTKNQEANYQKLLAVAKAELASFSTFTQNAGGSKLLANQTSCDSWGCYYSQRDTLWGNVPLNKTKFRLASDGCLVTAMAMMMTHYGYRNVTPVTINADSNNFASYYPAYLLYTIRVDGVTATRNKISAIDATLATGHPVIVGVHAYGGTHYVVLTSGSRGNYLMRDPYVANGKDISFKAHYSVASIFGITKVVITS